MKKLFVSIFALAAFAACQSDFSDVNLDAPQGGNANVGGSHTLYAEVGVVGEEDTKATYDEELNATWEEKDQIALLQEHANYGTTFGVVNKLNIKDGWGTSKALFNGEISVDATEPRVYHIAYPASAVEFATTSSMSVEGVSYSENLGTYLISYKFKASGYGKYTYNSTLNITIPTTQNGKWEPYMYASTSEAVNSEAIGAKVLTTLTGAIAVRAFEPDGKTPKQLKQIVIKSNDVAIAGAFTGTATSVGNTANITGGESDGGFYTDGSKETQQSQALNNLTSALQGYTATSTTVTKALSLSFEGSEKTITATNLDAIASEADGNYTYYINVAPATLAAGSLTIEATDVDGSTLKRVVDKEVVIAASHRAGFNLTWESATLKGATIETWYHNWNTGSQFGVLEGSTIYVDNVSVDGNISADQVLAIGVKINGTFHETSAQSGVLSISPIEISGLSSGVYKVQPVAKVSLNGEEKWLECAEVEKTVTSIPQVTDYSVRTSYSSNGTEAKTNDINGDILRVKANISDSYVANNLVNGKTYTICYGSNTATQTLGAEKDITLAYGAWGQYVCYVKIALANGYVCKSTEYTTHVTGIPYSLNFDSANPTNWTCNNQAFQDGYFILKTKEAYAISPKFHMPEQLVLSVSIPLYCYTPDNWGNKFDETFYVSASSGGDVKSSVFYTEYVSNNKYGDRFSTKTGGVTLDSSVPYICLHASGTKNSKIAGKNSGIFLKSFYVGY